MKYEITPHQARIFAELSHGMKPVQKRRLLLMLQQTDERFRPVREADMIPLHAPSSLPTATKQISAYREKLIALTSGSAFARATILSHIQDIENVKLEKTKATGRPRGSISFAWARRLALFKGNR